MQRWIDRGDRALVLGALVILLFGTAGGAWGSASDHVVLASELERSAIAPLYSAVAGAAAQLPIGEPWFRVGALNAVLGAVVLLGVARASRALLPKDPVAGYAAALTLAIAPPFRDAAGFPGPSMLAAAGAVWATAFAIEHARQPTRTLAWATFAAIGVVIGSAPWLGLALGAFAIAWLRPTRDALAPGFGALGICVVAWWLGAEGSLPDLDFDLATTLAATGRGSGSVIVGAGLLGIAFAGVTGLPHARALAAAIAIVALHAAAVDHAPVVVVAMLAPGLAVIPSGIVRAVPDGATRRHLIAAIAGAPLLAVALLSGPAFSVDDPGHAPARVAYDLTVGLPAGPGVLAITRTRSHSSLIYAQRVAGARPDLNVVSVDPILPDLAVGTAVRVGATAGADVPSLGRIGFRFAAPRARAYLFARNPRFSERSIPAPADYASTPGEQLAVLAAIDRARFEAGSGRLGDAARAAGLTDRFGAAELAILSTTRLVRPAFFGFIPQLDDLPAGRWLIELFGDDLAWVAGLEPAEVEVPRERKLHALWRRLWAGEIAADDPQIRALGPAAVSATAELLETKKNRR